MAGTLGATSLIFARHIGGKILLYHNPRSRRFGKTHVDAIGIGPYFRLPTDVHQIDAIKLKEPNRPPKGRARIIPRYRMGARQSSDSSTTQQL
jgi:hypothetical protein